MPNLLGPASGPGSCEVEPLVGHYVISRNAPAPIVHQAQVPLRACITLFGNLAIPLHGLNIILRHAPAFLVRIAQIELRVCMTLFSGLAIPYHGLSIILALIAIQAEE